MSRKREEKYATRDILKKFMDQSVQLFIAKNVSREEIANNSGISYKN